MTIEDRIIIKWERRGVNIKWQRWMRGKTGRLAGTRFQMLTWYRYGTRNNGLPPPPFEFLTFFFFFLPRKEMENKANREKEHQSILVRLSLQTFIFVVCSLSSIVGKLSVFQMRYDLVTADDVRGGDFLPATICAFVAAPHARGARLC